MALRSTAPILLTGPTGAGKSFLANRIYQLKQSRHQVSGKLVSVNCATLRGDNAMSTLFGHVKGAFTGALSARSGLLREADGGVLFLDEIAELGLDEQAMLLKAIEEKTFSRLAPIKKFTAIFNLSPEPTVICASGWQKDVFVKISMPVLICGALPYPALPNGKKTSRRMLTTNFNVSLAKARRKSASIKRHAKAIWPLPVPAERFGGATFAN